LAGNLVKPLLSLYGTEWRERGYVFLLAGALIFDEKIRQSASPLWFGLQDVEILYTQAVI
jgi:hypothetical protein